MGEYEITRLILDRVPDGSHVSTWDNWNCLTYLLEGAQQFSKSQTYGLVDFLMLLNRDGLYIDTETTDSRNIRVLQLASCWYSADVIRRILDLGASIANIPSDPWSCADNPILYSIHKSDLLAFKLFLPFYKDVNSLNPEGDSMLVYTARAGNVEMTDLLLQQGAKEFIPSFSLLWEKQTGDLITDPSENRTTILKLDRTDARAENESENSESCINGWLKPWVKENYIKYLKSLEKHRRVEIEWDSEGRGIPLEIFWDII